MRSPGHCFISTPLASSDAYQPSTRHGVLIRVSLTTHQIHGLPPWFFPTRTIRFLSEMPGHLFSFFLWSASSSRVNSPFRQSHVLEPFQFCPVRWRPSVFTFGFCPEGPSVPSCVAFMAPFPAFCDASQYSLAIHSTLASACNNTEHISVCISLQLNNPIELVIFTLSLSGSSVQSILLVL
jgi:hypothetical protein